MNVIATKAAGIVGALAVAALCLGTGAVSFARPAVPATAAAAKPLPSITIIDNGGSAAASSAGLSNTDDGSADSAGKAAKTDDGTLYFADPEDPANPVRIFNIVPGDPGDDGGHYVRRYPGEPPTGAARVSPGGGGGTTAPPPYTVAQATSELLAAYPDSKPISDGGDCVLVNSGGWSEGGTPPPPYVARIQAGGWVGYVVTISGNEGLVSWYGCYAD